ncbi:Oxidoreductase [Podila minutissima]|uniref:Mitochondrial intermembrane space import and assembly protein 40 n=1 Tax=Podila minutissima TaxID=64525 RepID=A0A9P5SP78_9FUNG|nr:Oxidoreductase [Podila minutissima]
MSYTREEEEGKDVIMFMEPSEATTPSPASTPSSDSKDQSAAFNPETGEINWDCPCLGGMAQPPCGDAFKEAFSCFVYSTAEPKGVDCVEKFKAMQDCFRANPEVYADQLDDDDEDEDEDKKEAKKDDETKNASSALRAGSAKSKASPYNKSAAGGAKPSGASVGAKKPPYQPTKPAQARNKHKNMNLTNELDSLLGDLNNQLQRKKTKKDARLSTNNSGVSAAEQALNEAQAKHEALQGDMMDALDGISALGK